MGLPGKIQNPVKVPFDQPFKIASLVVPKRVVLAPMAGYTDSPFRIICKAMGCGLVFTEMVSARGLIINKKNKSWYYLKFNEEERPIGAQLFGSEPEVLAQAAKMVEDLGPDIIDLNAGCSVRKVVSQGAGAALLKDLPRLGAAVSAIKKAVSCPVTVKIRSGWDDDIATQAAKVVWQAGADGLTIHGRTGKQQFRGKANWEVIGRVKNSIPIPVIGNGDIRTPDDARAMVEQTGCDAVMIGRGAIGRPWLFGQILNDGEKTSQTQFPKLCSLIIDHFGLMSDHYGGTAAVMLFRKHMHRYLRGIPGAAKLRDQINKITDPKELLQKLRKIGHCRSAPKGARL